MIVPRGGWRDKQIGRSVVDAPPAEVPRPAGVPRGTATRGRPFARYGPAIPAPPRRRAASLRKGTGAPSSTRPPPRCRGRPGFHVERRPAADPSLDAVRRLPHPAATRRFFAERDGRSVVDAPPPRCRSPAGVPRGTATRGRPFARCGPATPAPRGDAPLLCGKGRALCRRRAPAEVPQPAGVPRGTATRGRPFPATPAPRGGAPPRCGKGTAPRDQRAPGNSLVQSADGGRAASISSMTACAAPGRSAARSMGRPTTR